MMIADDHVNPQALGQGNLCMGCCPAVSGHHNLSAAFGKQPDRLGVESIPLASAVGNIEVGRHPQLAEKQQQLSAAGDSVHIVVTVDAHRLALSASAQETFTSPFHVGKQQGRPQPFT